MSPALFEKIAAALAEPRQPEASFAALAAALRQAAGHRFLTMLLYRWEEDVAERLSSSRPDLYSARGRKAFAEAPTQRRVAETAEPYIGRRRGHPPRLPRPCEELRPRL
jgi:hypothetical protein